MKDSAVSMDSIEPFLSLIACPKRKCGGYLNAAPSEALCNGSHRHKFRFDPMRRILILQENQRKKGGAEPDIYDYEQTARHYVGIWAYGYAFLSDPYFKARGWHVGRGETDAFYRVVSSLAIEVLQGRSPKHIWDIGCGVGRTVHDLAGIFPQSLVTGIDSSARMLEMAAEILFSDLEHTVDLRDAGFGVAQLRRDLLPRRSNALLVQANAEKLSIRKETTHDGVDLMLLINVLDRTKHPDKLLATALSTVRSGGSVIVGISGSWLIADHWKRFNNSIEYCLEKISNSGFDIRLSIEGIPLREQINARGAVEEWPVTLITATKR